MKKADLNAISARTEILWNRVIEIYGQYSYSLAVNGLGEVILCKGFTEEIAKGNREAQKVLRELLEGAVA